MKTLKGKEEDKTPQTGPKRPISLLARLTQSCLTVGDHKNVVSWGVQGDDEINLVSATERLRDLG